MGVWIETRLRNYPKKQHQVTPFVGVWIETMKHDWNDLKIEVTPFVGVWIETKMFEYTGTPETSHTLRGCVD